MAAALFFSVPRHHSLSLTILGHQNCTNLTPDLGISISPSLCPNFLANPINLHSSSLSKSSSINAANCSVFDQFAATDDEGSSLKSADPEYSLSPESSSHAGAMIKAPTAPWMKGPFVIPANQTLGLSKPRNKTDSASDGGQRPNRSLTDKVSGARGKKAMKKIFVGIGKLKGSKNLGDTGENSEPFEKISLRGVWEDEDSKYAGKKNRVKDNEAVFDTAKIGNVEDNQKGVECESLFGGFPREEDSKFGKKMPWENDERMVFRRTKKEKVVTAAELSVDAVLLERLRAEAARMRDWVKVKKAGVTQAVVDEIHILWKRNELVMLKFDIPLCRNMDRAQEIVELKTGGLVVWKRKDVLVIYRGCNYRTSWKRNSSLNISHQGAYTVSPVKSNVSSIIEAMSEHENEGETISIGGSLYEREGDRLLDGLGPRFVDWWRPKPLPVDADMLPEVVPGFKPPFRLCPPGSRAKLTDDELTYLRKLAHPLPTHFVLGRNRNLQGLALAMLKLWEKCHIVKIAVKYGIPNTNNEQMANELKHLTGGVLLLRNKFFIILYRGKDFLPHGIADMVVEREAELGRYQVLEEAARLKTIETFSMMDQPSAETSAVGTLSEFRDIQSGFEVVDTENVDASIELEAEKQRSLKELRDQEHKLFLLQRKIARSSKELEKLNSASRPSEKDADHEMITPEERACFRKMGLKMDSSLVLGRRGVFDGVMEGLHQHWKHREIAKVITKQRAFSQVIFTARLLEAESGGVLVSIERLKEGHAVMIYRGKNYKRPSKLVHQNLLNKREALFRSLEMQRLGSLKFFASQRQHAIYELKCKLEGLQESDNE